MTKNPEFSTLCYLNCVNKSALWITMFTFLKVILGKKLPDWRQIYPIFVLMPIFFFLYRIATDPWTHCDLIVWMLIRPNARNRRCYISIQRKNLREIAPKAQLLLRIHGKNRKRSYVQLFFPLEKRNWWMSEKLVYLFKIATIFVQKFIFVTFLWLRV